ncbi:MAG: hypothetical protein LPK45_03160 [Bacteroidota bacterium]|nr:hypothetical protein [Bacteroidota bacterium]MDX5430043.1 hypothetical protein [Bacteroidota bacterium]MDX5468813.1 hypothetical protein [Bacteroidota bacterium]
MNYTRATAFFFGIALLFACAQPEQEQSDPGILAKVYGTPLYLDDLPSDVREKLSGNDSLSLLKVYVNNWVKQQVALHKAQENLAEEIPDLEAKVRDYKNSLLIYEYQRALFEQLLDTTVKAEEISEYYEKNQKNFELKRNIVRLRYVKLPLEAENINKAKKWFVSEDESDRFKLLEFCGEHAVNTYMDEDTWLSFEDLLKEIPLNEYNQEHFLRNNKFVELKDNDYIYWLYIHSFRIKNSVSPLEFEEDRIRSIIINQRKLRLLQEMEESLLKEAEQKNEIEWYIE